MDDGLKKKLLLVQVIVAGLIFLSFAAGVFLVETYVLPYFLIPLIIGNIALKFVNKTKGLFANIVMLLLTFLLFIIVIGYIACIAGMILGFYHVLRLLLRFLKGKKEEEEKPENKDKARKEAAYT